MVEFKSSNFSVLVDFGNNFFFLFFPKRSSNTKCSANYRDTITITNSTYKCDQDAHIHEEIYEL